MTGSPRVKARLAGALYVISAVPAGFSVSVLLKLAVRGDPAATAANILASEGTFRLGFVAEIVGIMFFVASVLLLYELFKPVGRSLARLAVTFGLIGATIQSLDTLADMCALLLLKGGSGPAMLPIGQAQALALMLLRMHSLIYDLALVFFGVFSVLTGALVLKSSFLPRVIGVLMTLDGLGYLTFSLSTLLSPPFAAHLYPYLPFGTAILGEGPLMLWLIVKGVDARKWEDQAAAGRGDL